MLFAHTEKLLGLSVQLAKEDKVKKRTDLILVFSLIFFFAKAILPQTYEIVLQWGSAGNGNGQFNDLDQIAIDSSGNVYVADYGNNRIQKFKPDGSFITKWVADGASGIAIDSSGNVYVSDYDNCIIRKYTLSGTPIMTWGSYGITNGKFDDPWGVTVDSSNNVYIADYENNRIQKFSSEGTFVTKWTAYGAVGIAVDLLDNVYVSDHNSNHIRKYNSTGTFFDIWGSYGSGNGNFDSPWGVAVDSSGNVYVADYNNDRIQKFTTEGHFIAKWTANGAVGIAIDPTGNIFVSDWNNDRISKFSPIITIPTVLTSDVSSINPTNAICGGCVTSDGGSTVTARGICWSTSSNPDISDSKTADGSGTGNFESNLLDLNPSTTYYVRAYATNSSGTAYGSTINFTTGVQLAPEIQINRNRLNFGWIIGGDFPPEESIIISNSGGGTLNWSVTSDWGVVGLDPTSGTNYGSVQVTINPEGLNPGEYTGTITISDSEASNSTQVVAIYLKVKRNADSPFGEFSTPVDGSTVHGSIPVTGWVLDDMGVESVKLYRKVGNNLAYIDNAIFVEGARPDVEQAYPNYPMNYKAGWGYMMLTNFLPEGDGDNTIHAIACDFEGHKTTLGIKTINVDNENAIKPFGAIDTPTQGGTASGHNFINWGWVLTPQPNTIPTDGSTINVYVDGVNIGNPTYNINRSDIASLFPGYTNSNGAAGNFYIDTTAYENELHTIAWIAQDDAGNIDGIGSRYFKVENWESASSANFYRSTERKFKPPNKINTEINTSCMDHCYSIKFLEGHEQNLTSRKIYADNEGIIHIKTRELSRIVIHLDSTPKSDLSNYYVGYLDAGNQLMPLPIGSTFDHHKGILYWHLGPGFIGNYRLIFFKKNTYEELKIIIILVKIIPKFTNME